MSASSYPALVNPWASAVNNGLLDASPAGYADIAYDYVYDVALTANQILLDQQPLDNDADFVLRGIGVNYYTGAFAVRWADSTSYWFSNARIYYLNIINSAASPYPIWPEIIMPAGGRIMIDLQDYSAAPNTIEIVFRGIKRFKVPQES